MGKARSAASTASLREEIGVGETGSASAGWRAAPRGERAAVEWERPRGRAGAGGWGLAGAASTAALRGG
jgi:hypothetical protein